MGEIRRWEGEKTTLIEEYNGKNDELQRAMDDLEQLNLENTEYLQRIEEFESEAEAMREEASVSIRSSTHTELKTELEKREEQNENLIQQMEQLNSEHGDLQQLILSLQQEVTDTTVDLRTTKRERNELQDSLQETNELCLQLESRLSGKREKERML